MKIVYNKEHTMQTLISKATRDNWSKLGISQDTSKLKSRANKTRSTKFVLPIESIDNFNNSSCIENIIQYILTSQIGAPKALYSLSLNLLTQRVHNQLGVDDFVREYHSLGVDAYLIEQNLPADERDLLGVVYQAITPEGHRNMKGQYYTPRSVAHRALQTIDMSTDGYVLDPCCGSGSFLCEVQVKSPSQLLGIDIDPIAVMIAKANIMVRYCDTAFIPQIMCGDFLDRSLFSRVPVWLSSYYNNISVICTNPPWGADSQMRGGEIFSHFIRESVSLLNENGRLCFLLPESFGKIRTHADIRRHLLLNTILREVVYLPALFSGVVTSCMYLNALKAKSYGNKVEIQRDGAIITVPQRVLLNSDNSAFIACDSVGESILDAVKERGRHNLQDSIWALGIVTGDNKNKVSKTRIGEEWKPICTGKDIKPYKLKAPSSYVRYVRNELQQVAKEEIYSAPEKLVYKFISKSICFAYDNSRVLFLNSANILIPKIPNMSIKTVMAFLNSELFKFVYMTIFDDVKILKGNLCSLLFPDISEDEDLYIARCVDMIIAGKDEVNQSLQDTIYQIYNLSEEQINHIHYQLYGKVR